MKKKLSLYLIVIFILLSFSSIGMAKDIVIIPFKINTSSNYSYLSHDFPLLLKSALKAQGLNIYPEKQVNKLLNNHPISLLKPSDIKNILILSGVDYGLYGSFTQIGTGFSIDATLISSYGKGKHVFYISKDNILYLMQALNQLAVQIKEAIYERILIKDIKVKGNKILGKDVVLMRISERKGDVFSLKKVDEDIKRLYKSGYFEQIEVDVEDTDKGKILTFIVKEKPIIGTIEIKGAKHIKKKDILEAMTIKKGGLLNLKILSEDLDKIRELYKKKGYYNIKINYHLKQVTRGRAELILNIKEGKKLYIKKITIKGVKQLKEKDIKKVLALSERGFFSWLTGSGILKEGYLERDVAAIEAYYANRGFIDVKVGEPEVKFKKDGIYITFNVVEGERYKVGKVFFKGDIIVPEKELYSIIKTDDLGKENKYFNRSVLRKDTERLRKFYADYGYAFAEVDVDIERKPSTHRVNVVFNLYKRQLIFINRVIIQGNKKTRENVIRRALAISDGDRFSSSKIDFSKEVLTKLDYFDEVNIQTIPTSNPNKLDVKVHVKEKSTGFFSVGAGYSSIEKFFLTGQVTEKNLFGRGYSLSFKGSFSTSATYFQFSFWNPHLYDGPLGIGTDLYRSSRDYDDYSVDRNGGALKFAYSVGSYTRLYWNWSVEKYRVYNIDEYASDEIKDLKGNHWSDSIMLSAVRDSTNKGFAPTRGTINSVFLEYSGGLLGGDDDFIKTGYDFAYHHPLWWKFIFNYHFNIKWLFQNGGGEIPDFEKFYLGGINTVRGYGYDDISCYDNSGNEIGGYKEYYTNVEITFPIKEELGLLGVVFFDAGNVWDKGEMPDLDLYKSIGLGIRWNSPMGPLRLEYGYPLDKFDNNTGGRFEFSVGTFF